MRQAPVTTQSRSRGISCKYSHIQSIIIPFSRFPPNPGSSQKGDRAFSSNIISPSQNVNIAELETKTIAELRDIARDLELSGYSTLKKQDLVFRLLQANTEQQGNIFSAGVLEIVEDGF